MANRANIVNCYNSTLIISILLTSVLVTGIYTTNVQTVFADSTNLKLETSQNANCDTVGANSTVSDSCNQAQNNINVNNGGLITSGKQGPTIGTLIVNKVCVEVPGEASCEGSFNVQVTGNNPQPSSFSLTNGGSKSITLGSGSFTVSEDSTPGFTTSFSGDCMQSSSSGAQEATGTLAAGQHATCTITNTAVPATGTLTLRKVCSPDCSGFLFLISIENEGNFHDAIIPDGSSFDFILSPGSFSISEIQAIPTEGNVPRVFTTSFSGDCSTSGTGTISAGQHLTCTMTNTS